MISEAVYKNPDCFSLSVEPCRLSVNTVFVYHSLGPVNGGGAGCTNTHVNINGYRA